MNNTIDLLEKIHEDLKDFNIFIHGVSREKGLGLKTIKSIFDNGLNSDYFTIFRTIRDLGKEKDLVSEDLEYSFLSRNDNVAINVLVAIPDILSFQGNILPIYPFKEDVKDDGGHQTLLDVILYSYDEGRIVLPKEFVYGAYIINLDTKEIKFTLNEKHLINLDRNEYEKFYLNYKEKLFDKNYLFLIDLGKGINEDRVNRAKACSSMFSPLDDGISEKVVDRMLIELENKKQVKR